MKRPTLGGSGGVLTAPLLIRTHEHRVVMGTLAAYVIALSLILAGCAPSQPAASTTRQETTTEPTTSAVSQRWTTTTLTAESEAPNIAGDEGTVAWVGDFDYNLFIDTLWYQGADSDEPTAAAKVALPGFIWDLEVVDKRVFWTVETDSDPSTDPERYELFMWRPGDSKPVRLFSAVPPMEIGEVQVVGNTVLFSSRPARYHPANTDNRVELDQPVEWRLLDIRHPGVTRKLRFGAAGAQAVLGDGFVAWIEPGRGAAVRYARFTDGLALAHSRTVGNPASHATGSKPQAVVLQVSGRRLIWGLSIDDEIVGMATWRLGQQRATLVPGADSFDYETAALSEDRVAWVSEGTHTWAPGDAEATTLSTGPGGRGFGGLRRSRRLQQDRIGLPVHRLSAG